MAFTFAELEGQATNEEAMERFWKGEAVPSTEFPWREGKPTIFLRPDKDEHEDTGFWVEITRSQDGKFLIEFREPAA